MNSAPLLIGLGVAMTASYTNYKISTRYKGTLNAWYGWVSATIIRFFAIILSGLYVAFESHGDLNASEFILTLFFVILSGLFLDIIFSLLRIHRQKGQSFRKAC